MTAIALSNDVRTVARAQRSASRLAVACDAMNNIAAVVERDWWRLAEPEKELLRWLAEQMTNPPRRNVLSRVRFALKGLYWAFRADDGDVHEFVLAFERLKDALLDAIEREHPAYDSFVAGGLADALSGAGQVVSREQLSERIARIRDTAV